MTAAECREHVGKLRPQLIRFARSRLLNPAHAEDAVQETLLAAIENIQSFSGDSSLSSWLTGILKHKIVDFVRRAARDRWEELDGDYAVPDSAGWSEPERALGRRQQLEALARSLELLPARTAENFLLREVLGMNTAETCQALDVSATNCAVMLYRARIRIRASRDMTNERIRSAGGNCSRLEK